MSELRSRAENLRKAAALIDEAADLLSQVEKVQGEIDGKPTRGDLSLQTFPAGDLSDLTGLDAIVVTLEGAAQPLKKAEILRRMLLRGKKISSNTLDVYLSQNRNLFQTHGEGRWSLVKK